MAWTVTYKNHFSTVDGLFVYSVVDSLLQVGVEVYGSSNGVSFDNSGSGAVNYWVGAATAMTQDAWIRLRFPAVDGVIRELRIQKVGGSTLRRWTMYWSSGSTYFTSGASATVAPSCPTASDQQFVQNGTAEFEPNSLSISNKPTFTIVVGDADEGYSFFAGTWQQGSAGAFSSLFLDVLTDARASDADPAVYGGANITTQFGNLTSTHPYFIQTSIDQNNANCGGWYKKGTVDAAWVAYPLWIWGTTTGTPLTSSSTDRFADILQGTFSTWKAWYGRGHSAMTTQLGYKGKSRLFRWVSRTTGPAKLDVSRRLYNLGIITIPWDGTPFI